MKKTKKNRTKTRIPDKTEKKRPQKDYIFWILLLIIITSGLYFRLTNYAQEGIKSDGPTILATGLLWFHPNDFYPGLMQYNPIVPNVLIASGCMLSGEDFSAISNANPYFLPNLAALVGKQYTAAENYCYIPVYIAGIIVFLSLIIFSFIMLKKKEALFAIAFFAYNPSLLSWGRNLYTYVFVWMISIFGVIALWKYYRERKNTKKELLYAAITGAILGIAVSTKFTLALFFPFAIFILIEKYKDNILKKGSIRVPLPLLKSIIIFLVIYIVASLIPYEMNPKNFTDTYHAMTTLQSGADIKLDFGTLKALTSMMLTSNIIDLILLLYSAFIFYYIIKKKEKTNKEKYLLYYITLFLLGTAFVSNWLGGLRSIPFFFGIPILMALAFSNKEYSLLNKLNINQDKRTYITYTIIAIYIITNIFTLYPVKPYYMLRTNTIFCAITNHPDCNPIPYPANKYINSELAKILKENETFYDTRRLTSETHFYLRQEDYYYTWILEEHIKKQYNKKATIYDIILNYKMDNRTIKYLVIRPNKKDKEEEKRIMESTTPLKILKIKDIPVAYIYDVDTIPDIKKYRNSENS